MGLTKGYFNTASHGVPVAGVNDAMQQVLVTEAKFGPDGAAEYWLHAMDNTRKSAAVLVNSSPEEIGFSSTTTTSWHALLMRMNLSGKRVLVTEHEWYEYYNALELRNDIRVEILPALDFDTPDLSNWAAMIDDDVAAIMVPMVTSLTGQRYPVEAIGALPRPDSCKYIVEGAQSLGQMQVDVQALNCDAFLATGRKWLRGPRQTAFLWMNSGWAFTARDCEAADQNIALRVGLGVAIDHALGCGVKNIQHAILKRSAQIRNQADAREYPVVKGQTGTVAFHVANDQIDHITKIFLGEGITAKLPNARQFEPLSCRNEHTTVLRIAPHVYTTDDDINRLFVCLENCYPR